MINSPSNANIVSQPTPNVVGGNNSGAVTVKDEKQNKKYNSPNVGVVDVPTISTTPLQDIMEIKKKDNPRTIYKFTPKSNKGFKLQNASSIGIFACSVVALLSLLRRRKK